MRVEPKSRKDIRKLAYSLRKTLHLEDTLYFPVVEFLDVLEEVDDGFTYFIVSDDDLPMSVHAQTDIKTGLVTIKETVYNGAARGEGRDRMTIAHELGHYFTLCVIGFKLYSCKEDDPIQAYEDPEWQAKCFAGELLIPHHLVQDMTTPEVALRCGVSLDAARFQLSRD